MLPLVKQILRNKYHIEVAVMTAFRKQIAKPSGIRLVKEVVEIEEMRHANCRLAKFVWYALMIADFVSQRGQLVRGDS
jgi:hypothetical protein